MISCAGRSAIGTFIFPSQTTKNPPKNHENGAYAKIIHFFTRLFDLCYYTRTGFLCEISLDFTAEK